MKWNSFIFSYFIVSFSLLSQQSLSLKEAIQIALENNYGIKIVRKDLELAQLNNSWFNAGAFPFVNLNINPNLISNSIDQKFVNNTEIKRSNAVQKNLAAAIELNYNVLNGFKLLVTKEKLSQIEQLSEIDVQIKILDLYKEVAETYFKTLSLQNTLQTLIGQETMARNRKDLEEKRFNLGKTGKSSFLEAAIDLKDIEIMISQQIQAIKDNTNALSKLLLLDTGVNLMLTDSLNEEKLNSLLSDQCTLDQSIHQNRFLIVSKINKLEQDELRRQRFPNVNLIADYHYNKSVNQAGFNLFNQSYGPGIGVQLTVPIYDAQKSRRDLLQSIIRNEQISLQLESWRSDANYLIKNENKRINEQLKILTLESEKYQLATENFELIQKKSALGESNSLEYSQGQFKLIQSSASKNDAFLEIVNSYIKIHYLCSDLEKLLR